jgi:hypothetical protein
MSPNGSSSSPLVEFGMVDTTHSGDSTTLLKSAKLIESLGLPDRDEAAKLVKKLIKECPSTLFSSSLCSFRDAMERERGESALCCVLTESSGRRP